MSKQHGISYCQENRIVTTNVISIWCKHGSGYNHDTKHPLAWRVSLSQKASSVRLQPSGRYPQREQKAKELYRKRAEMTKKAKASTKQTKRARCNAALFLDRSWQYHIISYLRHHAHCSHSHTTHPEGGKKGEAKCCAHEQNSSYSV